MVILLGGESLTGKTLLAQRLLERFQIPYLSADHLKMGLYRANPACGFVPASSNKAIEAWLWPVLKGIIDTNIENSQSIIIEGCYIFPGRLREFTDGARGQIIPVFMGFSRRYLVQSFAGGLLAHRNSIEQRVEAETRDVEWFMAANEKWKAMCNESGARYFEIDGDYAAEMARIEGWIAAQAGRIRAGAVEMQ